MDWREVGGGQVAGTAVVGAGVGGCYTAYRLMAAAGRPGAPGGPVTLYERSHRTGGRIWSVGTRHGGWADLGAMRLHREAAPVMGLLDHLGLGSRLVPFEFGRGENLAYVRGTVLRQHQLTGPRADPPYRLRPHERGRGPEDLTLLAVETVLPGFTRLRASHHRAAGQRRRREARTPAAAYRSLRDAAALLGQPLSGLAWSSVLETVLSAEAVAYVDGTGGYDRHHGSAADWIDVLFRTPPHARYVTLAGGMRSLPTALRAAFETAGGRTLLGHRLCRIDRLPPSPYGRDASPAPPYDRGASPTPSPYDRGALPASLPYGRGAAPASPVYELTFALQDREGRDTGNRRRVRARTVVLALPQGALRHLDGSAVLFTRRLRRDIEAVQAVPAVKLCLAYDEPWWQVRGVTTGRSTTDTPLRQLWYGGTGPPAAPDGGPALLLAAYPNGPSAAYWNRFRDGPRYPERDGGAFGDAPRPSAAMVEHAHELLCAMHRVHSRPPVAACWQDWSRPPHDGAWHVWRPGHRSRAVAARMRNPVPGETVHVVSDCWTSDPGSIPGVLDCAERVLRDHLGLAPPPWHRGPAP